MNDVTCVLKKVNGNILFSCSCSFYRGLPMKRMKLMMDTVRVFPSF